MVFWKRKRRKSGPPRLNARSTRRGAMSEMGRTAVNTGAMATIAVPRRTTA
jgi:hypothetical protein